MRYALLTGLAAAAVALGTPAMAGTQVLTCAGVTSIGGFEVDSCGVFAGNLLNNSNNTELSADIASIGEASFTGTFDGLPKANTTSTISSSSGALSFGGQTLSGDTLIGIHYGNGGDESTIFYLLDVTSPVTSISGFVVQSFSTATLFSTGGVDAVPEPATWGMMLLGFAGMGMVLRRTRRRDGTLMQVA